MESGLVNLKVPLDLDVDANPWPIEAVNAILCINMIHSVFNLDLDSSTPEGHKEIILGAGCFWGVERRLWNLMDQAGESEISHISYELSGRIRYLNDGSQIHRMEFVPFAELLVTKAYMPPS